MPADLLPDAEIPRRAAAVDSPAMLRLLQQLRGAGFVQNDAALDPEAANALQRLSALGLIDPAYRGPSNGEPFLWVANHNGDRVLQHFERELQSKLKLHSRAATALATLSETDRQATTATLALLAHDPERWLPKQAVRLAAGQPLYLLRVSPALQAFFTVHDSGAIEVSDIVGAETLERFLEMHRAGSKVG